MGPDWPDEISILELKRHAEGLFIWIETVCRYLLSVYKPTGKLRALLSNSRKGLHTDKKMDELYTSILEGCGDWTDDEFLADYNLIMGTIVAFKRPLSLAALQALHHGTHELSPQMLLEQFGSVVTGFNGGEEPIRMLHLSFQIGRAHV